MNITERDVNVQLRLQSAVLEMIALRDDLDDVLATLCELVQELIPSSVASLMMIDKTTGRLNVRSAPGIPAETRACFDGLALSPNSGSCGNVCRFQVGAGSSLRGRVGDTENGGSSRWNRVCPAPG